jgi:hypothetical protein
MTLAYIARLGSVCVMRGGGGRVHREESTVTIYQPLFRRPLFSSGFSLHHSHSATDLLNTKTPPKHCTMPWQKQWRLSQGQYLQDQGNFS